MIVDFLFEREFIIYIIRLLDESFRYTNFMKILYVSEFKKSNFTSKIEIFENYEKIIIEKC